MEGGEGRKESGGGEEEVGKGSKGRGEVRRGVPKISTIEMAGNGFAHIWAISDAAWVCCWMALGVGSNSRTSFSCIKIPVSV